MTTDAGTPLTATTGRRPHPFPLAQGVQLKVRRKEHPDTGIPQGMPPGWQKPTVVQEPVRGFNTMPSEDVKYEKVSWDEIHVQDQRRSKYIPRARLFRFQEHPPAIQRDKWGKGRDQYTFHIEEYVGDMEIKETFLTTSSMRLMEQIEHEIDEYHSTGVLFKRWCVLTREGEGVSTTYLLRSFDGDMDAHKHYLACVEYMKGRE